MAISSSTERVLNAPETLGLDTRAAEKFLEPLLADVSGTIQIRERLSDFAEKSGIPL